MAKKYDRLKKIAGTSPAVDLSSKAKPSKYVRDVKIDVVCMEYMDLTEKIKTLTDLRDLVKSKLQTLGASETERFKVSVFDQTNTKMVAVDKAMEILGMTRAELKKKKLLSISSYTQVRVTTKDLDK